MKDLIKYLEVLDQFSKKKLKEHFKIRKLELESFETINSYLIYQTIRDYKNNTLLYIPDKETKSQFYIPAIFTLALYNFIDNFIDDTTVYEIGDVLQKSGNRYQIIRKSETNFTLRGKNAEITLKNSQIKKYIITTANLKNRQVKLKFNSYKEFFKDILNLNESELPSKFKYKSVIVTDKSIVSELKAHKINGEQIHKAFPFQYVTKSGKQTDNIPIDPMLFVVNDYETVRNHILTQNITIRNITFIGENKYKEHHLEITEDLNNGKIENCLLIGSTDLSNNSIPNLLKWKWTLAELDYFNYFTTYPINKIITENSQFTLALNDFNNSIKQIEEEYGINLDELYKYVRNILPIIIPSSNSRLLTQLDNALIYFEKEGEDIVETILSDIGEYDYDDIWNEISDKFLALINSKKTAHYKFQKIKDFQKIDYLIAPKEYLEIWQEEIDFYKVKNVISFKEFNSLTVKNKTIVFLGFFGYNHLKSMMYSSNKINILLYPQEEIHFNNCENKLNKETYNELKSADRKAISGISFKEIEHIENIDELINRLFSQDDEAKINPDYSESFATNIIRELTFENETEKLELDENKTVLLKIKHQERFEKVKNLKTGDKIRIYDNSSKEELYQVALEFDVNGEFTKIEEFSKLWKSELESFYKEYNSLNELHQLLVKNGLSIKNPLTLNNWIKPDSNVKFPQKKKDLSVIKKTINSELLNHYYNDIFKYRIGYNRIMKSLGRKFSSEISDYIQHKRKGKLLKQFTAKQIQQFVDQNAKERIIKTIKAIDYEQ
ncbi:DrmE family protein [Maribacter sp. TH_r10]|uniref:DrmE family protein n=1 Tax=Maribacter sp. TH_r10 TaxID=3082086 RepID=UPI002953CDDC|nr:DrmE family protein [Maribacter sp. TH_r10]MDV7138240.1 DrmE family protein [Maribacter sp. TH_r10]